MQIYEPVTERHPRRRNRLPQPGWQMPFLGWTAATGPVALITGSAWRWQPFLSLLAWCGITQSGLWAGLAVAYGAAPERELLSYLSVAVPECSSVLAAVWAEPQWVRALLDSAAAPRPLMPEAASAVFLGILWRQGQRGGDGPVAPPSREELAQLHRRLWELEALTEISRTSFIDQHPAAFYSGLTAQVARLLDAQTCIVFLAAPEQPILHAAGPAYGVPDDVLDQAALSYVDSAVAPSLLDGAVRDVADLAAIPTFLTLHQRVAGGKRAVIAARLMGPEEPIGLLILWKPEAGSAFDQDERRFLGDLAAQISPAVAGVERYQEAQAGRQMLRTALDNVVDSVTIYDAGGHIHYANPPAAELLGAYSNATVGTTGYPQRPRVFDMDWRLLPAASRPTPRALADGQPVSHERFGMEWPDGRRRYVDVSSAPWRDSRGRVSAAVTVYRDISQQVAAEQEQQRLLNALAASERRLRVVLETMVDGVMVMDKTGGILFANRNDAYGVGDPLLPGENIRDFLRPRRFYDMEGNELSAARLPAARVLSQGEVISHERLGIEWRGERVYYDLSAAPLRDAAGEIDSLVVVYRDISPQVAHERERDRLLKELAASEARLRVVLETMVDGVTVVDSDDRVTFANHAVAHHWIGHVDIGDRRSDYLREIQFSDAEGRPVTYEQLPLTRSLRAGEVVSHERVNVQTPTGQRRYLDLSSAPLRDSEGNITGALSVFRDISAQVSAEREQERLHKELETREAHLRVMLETMVDGVVVIDTNRRYLFANSAVEQEWGRSLPQGSDANGQLQDARFYDAEGQLCPLERLPRERALMYGETTRHERIRYEWTDGRQIYYDVSAAPLRDAEGTITSCVVVFRDISQEVRYEQEQARLLRELEASEARLRVVLETMVDAVVVLDTAGKVVFANQALDDAWGARVLSGADAKEYLHHCRFYNAAGEPMALAQLPGPRSLRYGETTSHEQVTMVWSNGRRNAYDVSAAPLRNAAGEVTSCVLVIRDISRHVAAEEEREQLLEDLEASEGRLRVILETMDDAVVVLHEGKVIFANQRFREFFDLSFNIVELTLDDLAARLTPCFADPARYEAALCQFAEHPTTAVTVNLELAHPEHRFLQCISAPVLGPDGDHFGRVELYRDITDLRTQDLKKDAFLFTTGQQLRGPLTVVKGYGLLLQKHLAELQSATRAAPLGTMRDLTTMHHQIANLTAEADRLITFVERFQDVLLVDADALHLPQQALDMVQLIVETVERLKQEQVAHPIIVQGPPEGEDLTVLGDTARLQQVLTILIENAVQYSPVGAPIEVTLIRKGGTGGQPACACIQVRDRGIGLEPGEAAQVFQRFYRGPRAQDTAPYGLGIGLYLAEAIVRYHGGGIWAESAGPGQGTTFSIRLPLLLQS